MWIAFSILANLKIVKKISRKHYSKMQQQQKYPYTFMDEIV